MDGITIVALMLKRLHPHHKVDMYSKFGAVKKMTIAQFDNDINLFFDSIKSDKLQIDSKDPLAYTDDAFVCDIFCSTQEWIAPNRLQEWIHISWKKMANGQGNCYFSVTHGQCKHILY